MNADEARAITLVTSNDLYNEKIGLTRRWIAGAARVGCFSVSIHLKIPEHVIQWICHTLILEGYVVKVFPKVPQGTIDIDWRRKDGSTPYKLSLSERLKAWWTFKREISR